MTAERERELLRWLVGSPDAEEARPQATDCLDENQLAALVAGRVLEEERPRLDRHLAACARCRADVKALLGDQERDEGAVAQVAPPPQARRSSRRPALLTAAAALALLAMVATWLLRRGDDPERTLFAAAAELALAEPELFRTFRPLDRAERLAPSPAVVRGRLGFCNPAGTVLETRPVFRWAESPAVAAWEVAVMKNDGTDLWTESSPSTSLEYPPGRPALAAGERYVLEVTGNGPLGTVRAVGSFAVASATQMQEWAKARGAIERLADSRVRDVLIAHWALRHELWAVAEASARARLRAAPDDTLALETLVSALRRLRPGEAEALERGR